MGKKQFGEQLKAKQNFDLKKAAKRQELKEIKAIQIKKKLGTATEKELKKIKKNKKQFLTKEESLALKQKAVKRVDPMLAAQKKHKKRASAKPKIDDYADFANAENHAYNLLRKRTILKLKLDKDLIKQASNSLLKFRSGAKKSNDNLNADDDDFIYLEIILAKIPEEFSVRPLQIPLPVPIYSVDQSSKFCVFTKDPQREYKDKVKNLRIPTIARVLGYSKIEKKFPTYKDKLNLFYSYDMFFVDHSIYDLIRRPTGKIFYERKKIPFPINCQEVPATHKEQFGNDYEAYLNDLANYTYFSMGNGPKYTVKIARTNMNTKDIVKNVIHGVYNTVPHLLKQKVKHNKVQQINLKTFNSISLPIFNQLTEEEEEKELLALTPTAAAAQ